MSPCKFYISAHTGYCVVLYTSYLHTGMRRIQRLKITKFYVEPLIFFSLYYILNMDIYFILIEGYYVILVILFVIFALRIFGWCTTRIEPFTFCFLPRHFSIFCLKLLI